MSELPFSLSDVQAQPLATSAPCIAHGDHRPEPLYCEEHHVIPQAWQRFWKPEGAAAGKLWDARTVALCRTGHGNVHVLLVATMRAFERGRGDEAYNIAAALRQGFLDVRSARGVISLSREERRVAAFAVERYTDAGGNLMDLCRARLYGGMFGIGGT